mgnify:CR=1 FL=1
MIRLDTTTRSLEVVLGGAITTTNPDVVVSYSDKNASADTYIGATKVTATNGVTAVTVAAAPGSGVIRDVDYFNLRNNDTVSVTATVRYNDNATLYKLVTCTLLTGEQLVYTHGNGWASYDINGSLKTAAGGVLGIASGGSGASTAAGAATNFGLGTGDSPQFIGINLGHATDTTLSRSAAGVLAVEGEVVQTAGKQTIWIPAGAITTRTTNGALSVTTEMTTNKNMVRSLDFDATTQEFAQFDVVMPKSGNDLTVTFQPVWTAASGTGGVVFGLAGVATRDDDAMDVAFGTAQTSTDTFIVANDAHIGPESSAITIAGVLTYPYRVNFQVNRTVADASDTLGVDAKLLGIFIIYTIDAKNDA